MSRVTLSPGLEKWQGKVSGKSGMTMRIKSYRDDEGHIVSMGPQEYYRKEKRDFKVHPRSSAEEAQRQIWQEVCREASAIVRNPEHPRYAELRGRWNAQFKGSCDAFLNEGQTKKKIYGMFPVFVRMVLLNERKS